MSGFKGNILGLDQHHLNPTCSETIIRWLILLIGCFVDAGWMKMKTSLNAIQMEFALQLVISSRWSPCLYPSHCRHNKSAPPAPILVYFLHKEDLFFQNEWLEVTVKSLPVLCFLLKHSKNRGTTFVVLQVVASIMDPISILSPGPLHVGCYSSVVYFNVGFFWGGGLPGVGGRPRQHHFWHVREVTLCCDTAATLSHLEKTVWWKWFLP